MTPMSGFHAYPSIFYRYGIRKHSEPSGQEVEAKRSAMTIVFIIQLEGKYIVTHDSNTSSSIPSKRRSNLQSRWEYLAATSTWSYTKLTGISSPFGPSGLIRLRRIYFSKHFCPCFGL